MADTMKRKGRGSSGLRHFFTSPTFIVLFFFRLSSAFYNIIQDCDEVFNFWEPLHFSLFGTGLQTWENSSDFALRSWLYTLVHKLPAMPVAFATGGDKLVIFYTVRACLAAASAIAETQLCNATAKRYGSRLAWMLCLLLSGSAGMFSAATAFLPSSFSMMLLCAASAAALQGRLQRAVALCVVGGLLGWPFAGLACIPIGLQARPLLRSSDLPAAVPSPWTSAPFTSSPEPSQAAWQALWVSGLRRTTGTLAASVAVTLGASLLADHYFYGRWTLAVLNLLRYNVVGGGDSALYGVEGRDYYLRTGALAFNLVFPAALLSAALEAAAALLCRRRPRGRLLVVSSAIYLWLGFMSAIPHKEERFLYVVYPQVLLAAAMGFDACWEAAPRLVGRLAGAGLRALLGAALLGSLVISYSRVAALVSGYSAPLRVLETLAPAPPGTATRVFCIGREWYRFPSSFFLPSPSDELRFVDSGDFKGMLPMRFQQEKGGAAFTPPGLNSRNQAAAEQWTRDPSACDVWIATNKEEAPKLKKGFRWEQVVHAPLLDAAASKALPRAFFIPGVSAKSNKYVEFSISRKARAA